MPLRRQIARVLYGLVGLVSFGLGLYFFSSQFTSYHEQAVGKPWTELPSAVQTLVQALMEVAGGGWFALFTLISALLLVPFRRGERWARIMLPIGILTFYVLTLYATLRVLRATPAIPPWWGAALACLAAIVGFFLDRSWSNEPDRPLKTAPKNSYLIEGETECLSGDDTNTTFWLQVAQLSQKSGTTPG